jgi:hypothetical protein
MDIVARRVSISLVSGICRSAFGIAKSLTTSVDKSMK